MEENLTLKDFQQNIAVPFVLKNKYSILGMEPGLGKGPVTLWIQNHLKKKMLIFMPSYLIANWIKEIKKFYPGKSYSAFKKGSDIYDVWDSEIVFISYSYLDKAEKLFEWADIVVYEEAHFLKNMKSKRADIAHRMTYENSVQRCILLTGTPIKNRIYEFYSLLALCNYNPAIQESKFLKDFPTYVDFANKFSYLEEFEINRGNKRVKVQKWEGARNMALFQEYTKDFLLFMESEKYLDLDPKNYVDVVVDNMDHPALLEAFEAFRNGEGNDSVTSPVKRDAAIAMVPFTIEYVKDLLASGVEKVVVFSDHPEPARLIAEAFGVKGIYTGVLDHAREKILEGFMNGASPVLSATVGTLSTGRTLTVANHEVINDPPWVPGDLRQIEDRIRRIGQTKPCFYHRMMGSYQAQHIYKVLKDKQTTINKAFKGV